MDKTLPGQTGMPGVEMPGIPVILQCVFLMLLMFDSSAIYAADVTCQSAHSDLDGDGWGWENNASCVVSSGDAKKPECRSAHSDPDGDGWGWENGQACLVTVSRTNSSDGASRFPACSGAGADPDGDGYGWESGRTCQVKESNTVTQPIAQSAVCSYAGADTDGDGFGWENGRTCVVGTSTGSGKTYRPEDITDLLLVTGQSNTLGANTSVDYQLDNSHPRVFAYTSNGWRVAELHQVWDRGRFPGPGYRNASQDVVANNFALHFGKRLAELDAAAVVGFVLVAEPGEGIEHWDPGNRGMNRVQHKVAAAINELPHKTAIDGILWHQGETDWLYDGTADPDVEKPAPKYYYRNKLAQLIGNFRLENWYDNQTPFICGETISASGINAHLNGLNYDRDSYTACVEGYGLPSRHTDGSHFNASGLRTIGQRFANSYYDLSRN